MAGERENAAGANIDGWVTAQPISRLEVHQFTVSRAQILRWTPAHIAGCAQPPFMLVSLRGGQGSARHCGAEVNLGAGECVLLDGREPFELLLADASEGLLFKLPVDWVEGCLPDPRVAVAVPLGNRPPWSGLLRDVMDTIHADEGDSPPLLIARSLRTALALTVDAIEVRSTVHGRKTFQALQRTLTELAPHCHVTVADIAEAHGISTRYLHAICAANGTSCVRELMRVRLERAQRLLQAAGASSLSIDEIAWQCGFADTGHFRRRFRAHYGIPPSVMRQGAAG